MCCRGISSNLYGIVRRSQSLRRYGVLFLAALVGCPALTGVASAASVARPYAGAGVGLALSKTDKGSLEFQTDDLNNTEGSWRVFGGYRFHPILGIEAGYIALGKGKAEEQVNHDYFSSKVSGFDVTAIGSVSVMRGIAVFARGGLFFWSSDISFKFTDRGTGTDSHTGIGPALGTGVRYDLRKFLALRGDYTFYGVDKGDAGAGGFSVISVGLMLTVGL